MGIIVGVNSVSITIENGDGISITAGGSSQITGIGNGILIHSVDSDTDSQTLAWGVTTSKTTAIEISSGNVLTLETGFGLNLSNVSDKLTLTLSETGFETENGVTSNSKGDFANDDFVFGSTQLSNVKAPKITHVLFLTNQMLPFELDMTLRGIGVSQILEISQLQLDIYQKPREQEASR